MNTVDCVSEIMEECYQEGFEIGLENAYIEFGIKVLEKNYPIEKLAEIMEIPVEKLESEYEKYKKSKKCSSNATL